MATLNTLKPHFAHRRATGDPLGSSPRRKAAPPRGGVSPASYELGRGEGWGGTPPRGGAALHTRQSSFLRAGEGAPNMQEGPGRRGAASVISFVMVAKVRPYTHARRRVCRGNTHARRRVCRGNTPARRRVCRGNTHARRRVCSGRIGWARSRVRDFRRRQRRRFLGLSRFRLPPLRRTGCLAAAATAADLTRRRPS